MHKLGRQHGLSLVETMVGLAVGLGVVAGAMALSAGSLGEGRRQLDEARLMQDLRAAADVVSRHLRRSGHWAGALTAPRDASNPYLAGDSPSVATDTIAFQYSRDPIENDSVDDNERFGFRLRNGTLEMQLGGSAWQALTDARQLTVSRFELRPQIDEIALPCPEACRADTDCPPRQRIHRLAITLAARAAKDPVVVRTLRSELRVRNDAVIGRCET